MCCVLFPFVLFPFVFKSGGETLTTPPTDPARVVQHHGPQPAKAICEHSRRCEETYKYGMCGHAEKREKATIQILTLPPSHPLHVPTYMSLLHVPVLHKCTSSCVHWVTPPPVSLLHASFLLIVSCFCLTDMPSSKDVRITEALQIGHACSIPLRAPFEERQPARFCFIYRPKLVHTLEALFPYFVL